jgi:arylsulfatase
LGLVNCALSDREPGEVPYWNLSAEELRHQINTNEIARAVAWSELSEGQKRFQATKMAIHAAMIDRMDREIGRVLDQLRTMGALENTIVVFASDNGASAEFLNRGDKHDPSAEPGSGGSYLCLGPGWSTAANTPFRMHKSWVHEGGISTPLIVHWPKGIRTKGELRHTAGHVIDIVPTVLELTGARSPQEWNGVAPPVFPGRSLVPALAKDTAVPRDFLYFHHENNHALLVGDWKLVSKRPNTNDYALYDLSRDRCERINLVEKQPERAASMARQWEAIEASFRALANSGATPRQEN